MLLPPTPPTLGDNSMAKKLLMNGKFVYFLNEIKKEFFLGKILFKGFWHRNPCVLWMEKRVKRTENNCNDDSLNIRPSSIWNYKCDLFFLNLF